VESLGGSLRYPGAGVHLQTRKFGGASPGGRPCPRAHRAKRGRHRRGHQRPREGCHHERHLAESRAFIARSDRGALAARRSMTSALRHQASREARQRVMTPRACIRSARQRVAKQQDFPRGDRARDFEELLGQEPGGGEARSGRATCRTAQTGGNHEIAMERQFRFPRLWRLPGPRPQQGGDTARRGGGPPRWVPGTGRGADSPALAKVEARTERRPIGADDGDPSPRTGLFEGRRELVGMSASIALRFSGD